MYRPDTLGYFYCTLDACLSLGGLRGWYPPWLMVCGTIPYSRQAVWLSFLEEKHYIYAIATAVVYKKKSSTAGSSRCLALENMKWLINKQVPRMSGGGGRKNNCKRSPRDIYNYCITEAFSCEELRQAVVVVFFFFLKSLSELTLHFQWRSARQRMYIRMSPRRKVKVSVCKHTDETRDMKSVLSRREDEIFTSNDPYSWQRQDQDELKTAAMLTTLAWKHNVCSSVDSAVYECILHVSIDGRR